MSERQTDRLTRRQAIAGGTVALAGLTVAAKIAQAQTETPQQPQTKPQEVSLVTPEELGLWTLDLATNIAEGKSLISCLTICGLRAYLDRGLPPPRPSPPVERESNSLLQVLGTVRMKTGQFQFDSLSTGGEGRGGGKPLSRYALRTKNDVLRRTSDIMLKTINLGYPLSDAMELNRFVFDRNYVTTVRYGEIYGILDEALKKMLEQRFKMNTE